MEELVEKIERFLNMSQEKRALMGKRGRQRMIRNFSRKKVIAAYLSKLEEL